MCTPVGHDQDLEVSIDAGSVSQVMLGLIRLSITNMPSYAQDHSIVITVWSILSQMTVGSLCVVEGTGHSICAGCGECSVGSVLHKLHARSLDAWRRPPTHC